MNMYVCTLEINFDITAYWWIFTPWANHVMLLIYETTKSLIHVKHLV